MLVGEQERQFNNGLSFLLNFLNEIVHTYHIATKGDMMEVLTWQARTKKNVTLVQLAEMTGISKSTLNNIENGRTSPTLDQLEAIATALDVRITDLFDAANK